MEKSPLTAHSYLLDTHALFQWVTKSRISMDFVSFLDAQSLTGKVFVSSISFWEFGLLAKSGRLSISDIHLWKKQILENSPIKLIHPGVDEMIDSTLLPKHHKDPFDRLLISQALSHEAMLVTEDVLIQKYEVKTFWM